MLAVSTRGSPGGAIARNPRMPNQAKATPTRAESREQERLSQHLT